MVKNRLSFLVCCTLAIGLSACQTALTGTPRATTQEDYCPDCIKSQARNAMTWATLNVNTIPAHASPMPANLSVTVVGADDFTDATDGDTPVDQSAPVLCRRALGYTVVLETGDEISDALNVTAPIRGDTLGSKADADRLCETELGSGWHMLETSVQPKPLYLVGVGAMPTDTRFWVAHPAAPVNPWID
jgi:hypothetical protein